MRKIVRAIAFAVALVLPASALAGSAGMLPAGYQTYDNAKYLRLADCHLTDSMVDAYYSGSLAAGQSFSAYLDLCYADQYVVLYGPDEQTDEDFAFDVQARGNLAVSLTLIRRGFPDQTLAVTATPGKPTSTWMGCAYAPYWTTYDSAGMSQLGGARLLVTLTNPSSRTVRDIGLGLHLAWAGFGPLRTQHGC